MAELDGFGVSEAQDLGGVEAGADLEACGEVLVGCICGCDEGGFVARFEACHEAALTLEVVLEDGGVDGFWVFVLVVVRGAIC